MATFHRRYNKPDENGKEYEPDSVLLVRGAFVRVVVSVRNDVAEQIKLRGESIPKPMTIYAMLDIGASDTFIETDAAKRMGLKPFDQRAFNPVDNPTKMTDCYAIHVEIEGTQIGYDVLAPSVTGLARYKVEMLIGRDFLRNCTLLYNGIKGEITLENDENKN